MWLKQQLSSESNKSAFLQALYYFVLWFYFAPYLHYHNFLIALLKKVRSSAMQGFPHHLILLSLIYILFSSSEFSWTDWWVYYLELTYIFVWAKQDIVSYPYVSNIKIFFLVINHSICIGKKTSMYLTNGVSASWLIYTNVAGSQRIYSKLCGKKCQRAYYDQHPKPASYVA